MLRDLGNHLHPELSPDGEVIQSLPSNESVIRMTGAVATNPRHEINRLKPAKASTVSRNKMKLRLQASNQFLFPAFV